MKKQKKIDPLEELNNTKNLITKELTKKHPKPKEYTHKSVFVCGLCWEKVGGGKVSLVTHAVIQHGWAIKEVVSKAIYQGEDL